METAMMTMSGGCGMPAVKPVLIQMEERKKILEQQLADVDAAIAAIKENPGVEAVLNAIQRVGCRY
jgi:hypothetical protein